MKVIVIFTLVICGIGVESLAEKLVEYVKVTSEIGTAYASSEYKGRTGFEADKAFGEDGYWCSVRGPDTPVRLWFQFKEPTRVVQIKFKEQYKMSGEDGYQVFGSDAVDNCGGPNNQKVLTEAPASLFVTGKEFQNDQFFYCYGIQTDSYGRNNYVSAKELKFGFGGGLREKRNNDDFVNEYDTPKNCSFFIFGAGKTYEVVFKGKEQGYIGTYPAHWERARLACQRLGGDLAQPSTWEEQDKIEAALRKLPTNNMRCAQYYIGVKKDWTTGRGVPIWLSGQEMESDSGLKFEKYSSWFSNTTSACGAISAGGVVGGGATNQEGIKNVDCRNGSGVFGYVCEYANASPNCIP